MPCLPPPQGRGRARQSDSSFVVLSERADRPTALLAEVEQLQSTIVRNFQPVTTQRSREELQAAQRCRDQTARDMLSLNQSPCQASSDSKALAELNSYSQRTKGDLEERFSMRGEVWECTLVYQSVLREVHSHGAAPRRSRPRHRPRRRCSGN